MKLEGPAVFEPALFEPAEADPAEADPAEADPADLDLNLNYEEVDVQVNYNDMMLACEKLRSRCRVTLLKQSELWESVEMSGVRMYT